MSNRPAWHTLVVWRRGPLGSLHAQWIGEDVPGAACCSESAALSGPPVEYDAAEACRNCSRMALSLLSQGAVTMSVNPRPL